MACRRFSLMLLSLFLPQTAVMYAKEKAAAHAALLGWSSSAFRRVSDSLGAWERTFLEPLQTPVDDSVPF
jgi:hypothetical protein